MSYQRLYPQRINWEDEPSLATPINQVNLNKMDAAIYGIDGRVVELDENKAGKNETFNTTRNGVVPKPTQADITNEKVLRADGTWVEQTGGGGGSGGHTIVNNAGTSLTQRSKLKTVGGLNATDDSVNNTTEITDVVEEVPWATWQSYPSEEEALQAHPNCVVTGAPDCDGDIEIENLHLAWSNPNPTSVFAGQTVPLDTETDWDFARVYVSYSNSNPSKNVPFVEMEKGTNGQANCSSSSTYGVAAIYRNITVDDDTHISFGGCAVKDMSQSAVELNQFLIPIKIYTYKKDLTAKIQAIARNVSTEASKCMLDENTSVADFLSVETETVSGVVFSKQGNIITIYGYGISPSSMPTIPEKYRPKSVVLSPAVYLNSGNLFDAYIGISTAGAMNPSYSATYGGQAVTPSGGAMYFSISYNNA